MIEPIVLTQCIERHDGAGLGIGCAKNQSADAGVDDGAGAHGARFERDDERAVVESPVPHGFGRLTQRDQFGVGRRIGVNLPTVVGGAEFAAGIGFVHHGANRRFVHFHRLSRKVQRTSHHGEIRRGRG